MKPSLVAVSVLSLTGSGFQLAAIMQWGGAWQAFGRGMICAMAVVQALIGIISFIVWLFLKHNEKVCTVPGCPEVPHRYCDHPTDSGSGYCGRYACRSHMHVVGGRDFCQHHHDAHISRTTGIPVLRPKKID